MDTPNGPMELTFEFKAEGETLTGTVTSAMGSLPISNGKVAGDLLTFDVDARGEQDHARGHAERVRRRDRRQGDRRLGHGRVRREEGGGPATAVTAVR